MPKDNPEPVHNENLYSLLTLTVEGARGRGKTSFIRWIMEKMKEDPRGQYLLHAGDSKEHEIHILVHWDKEGPLASG